MKFSVFLISLLLAKNSFSQNIELKEARFQAGDVPAWKEASFDDSSWKTVNSRVGNKEDFAQYDGAGWYRFRFTLPHSLRDNSVLKESLRVVLNKADDNETTYWNGVKIGSTKGWDKVRSYLVNANSPFIKWDAENVIAVRVEDFQGPGGLYGGIPFIAMADLIDLLQVRVDVRLNYARLIVTCNAPEQAVAGDLTVEVFSTEDKKRVKSYQQNFNLKFSQQLIIPIVKDLEGRNRVEATVREKLTGKTIKQSAIMPYLLTPKESKKPQINGAKIFGVRPGSPVLCRIAATGAAPMTFSADRLPKELKLDAKKGIISGVLKKKKKYKMTVKATNALGSASREFTIVVGELQALTPPMGWNSWNCWGLSVSEAKVKASAEALISKGLVNHGWSYINIDDGWQSESRRNGNISTNKKFENMKALGDWLHGEGLKFGIYSSPGERTCGGFLGSLGHEETDAKLYADWGIDYLKYDWCSYSKEAGDNTDLAAFQKPYLIMRDALAKQNRDIVYSLCQYGMGNVWEWGEQANGNCWRTTGDIEDSWESISGIGFSQTAQHKYAKPGRWNDPDMLSVGKVGWGENLRNSRLTCDEQYAHLSLWCLLNAPLLMGCDVSKLDEFTLNLLANDEVLAVNQDVLGIQAAPKIQTPAQQVWMKETEDGHAIGIFNTSEEDSVLTINWSELGFSKSKFSVRDLWRQKDLGIFDKSFSAFVPSHGAALIKATQK